MEEKKTDGTIGAYAGLFGREHVKIPLISDREDGQSNSSHSSSGSLKRRRKVSSDSEDSRDGRDRKNHPPIGRSLSKKTRPGLRSRKSSESSSEDEKGAERNFDGKKLLPGKDGENAEKTLYPWHTQSISFRLKGNLSGDGQSSDAIKQQSSEIKEMRLSQLSSERDRSISVDRSSSSSEGKISMQKKLPTSLPSQSPEKESLMKSPSRDIERKAHSKEYSASKTSNDSSRTHKDLDRHMNDRKKSSGDDKFRSKPSRSQSRSRSRSQSMSKNKRRGNSPRRDRHRSRDKYRNRSPKRSPRPRTRRSRSRGHRSRSRGYRSRSRGYRSRDHRSRDRHRRSRSYDKRRYRRDRSGSRDHHRKRRRSHSSSRSRSRGRTSCDRSKGRSGLSVSKVGSLPLSTTSGAMTPQMALQQTMAAMSAKAQALTGIELPKYYNPAAVNPLKYAEQVQKRKLLWQSKKEPTEEQSKNTVWDKLTFSQDQDGKMTAKFRKLMGIKNETESANENEAKDVVAEGNSDPGTLQKQEELFRNLDQQYEMARMSTHTHRGVGLGYSSQAIFPPLQKP